MTNSLRIEELTGTKRSIELFGAALPRKGAAWSEKMRMKTETYAGNPLEATQQILGPVMLPSEWEGFWRTTQLIGNPCEYTENGGYPQQVTLASTLRDILEMIFESGQRLRVTWSTEESFIIPNEQSPEVGERRIVRIGRASEWKFSHDRMDDIAWNITFEWISKGASVQKKISTKGEDVLSKARACYMAVTEWFVYTKPKTVIVSAKQLAANQSASSLTLGDLENLASAPLKLWESVLSIGTNFLNTIGGLINVAQQIGNLPSALANQTNAAAKNMSTILSSYLDEQSQTPYEAQTQAQSNKASVNNTTQAFRYFSLRQIQAEVALDQTLELQRITASKKSAQFDGTNQRSDSADPNTILGIWIARAGDTYASISNRFYGTPDYSYALAKVNVGALPPTNSTVKGRPYAVAPPVGANLIIPTLADLKTRSDI